MNCTIGWILFAAIWIITGVLAYGIALAYIWFSFPTLMNAKQFREDRNYSLFYFFLFPMIALPTLFFITEYAKHGLLFRQPKGLK